MDIVNAYKQIDAVKTSYRNLLSSVDKEFNKVFVLATEMANSVNVEPSMPQFAKRQIYNVLSTA